MLSCLAALPVLADALMPADWAWAEWMQRVAVAGMQARLLLTRDRSP